MNSLEWFLASLGTILLAIGILVVVFVDSFGWWLVGGAVVSYLASAAVADKSG